MRIIAFICAICLCGQISFSQSFSVSNSINSDLTTCGNSEVFHVELENTSGVDMNNVSLNISFPNGVIYESGSLSELSALGANIVATNSSSLDITVSALADGAVLILEFNLSGNHYYYN